MKIKKQCQTQLNSIQYILQGKKLFQEKGKNISSKKLKI